MMCVVVFQFHQSIIDLCTIKQLLHEVSTQFLRLSGMADDENERRKMNAASHSMFGNIWKYPSAFNLSPLSTDKQESPDSDSRRKSRNGSDSVAIGAAEEWMNFVQEHALNLKSSCFALMTVLRMFWLDEGNVFEICNGYSGTKLMTESCDDTALMKVQRAAKAKFENIGRTCVAGALLRYFQDLKEDGDDG